MITDASRKCVSALEKLTTSWEKQWTFYIEIYGLINTILSGLAHIVFFLCVYKNLKETKRTKGQGQQGERGSSLWRGSKVVSRVLEGEIRNKERGPWGRGEQAPWGGERCNTAFGVEPAGLGGAGRVRRKNLPGGRHSIDGCQASEFQRGWRVRCERITRTVHDLSPS